METIERKVGKHTEEKVLKALKKKRNVVILKKSKTIVTINKTNSISELLGNKTQGRFDYLINHLNYSIVRLGNSKDGNKAFNLYRKRAFSESRGNLYISAN